MKTIKNLFLASLVGICALAFGSCGRSEDDKGPMEKAGKAIDQTMEKAGKAIKDAGEKMRDGDSKDKK